MSLFRKLFHPVGGDSGAPIYKDLGNNTAQLVGMHVGRGCFITGINGTLFNIPGCDQYNRNPLFKVFSPWDNIAHSLDIQ